MRKKTISPESGMQGLDREYIFQDTTKEEKPLSLPGAFAADMKELTRAVREQIIYLVYSSVYVGQK